MKKLKLGIALLLVSSSLFLGGCNYALISSDGYTGQQISNYILITAGLMLIVVIPTILLVVWTTMKYRKGNNSEYEPEWEHSNKIEFWAWGVPIIIIGILATITYFTSHSLDPRKKIDSNNEKLTIQVVSLEWKWLFIYPNQKIATINEIYMPVNTPVEFLLTSGGVMNSFIIPRLGGQLYAMAGMENKLNSMALKKGVYDGLSSVYSGFGFSGMRFKAHVVSNKEFNQWINKVKTSNKKLDNDMYNKLLKRTSDNPVEYFGSIDPLQYRNVIEKFTGVR